MTDIAFHANPAVKAEALERLRRHIAAGTLVYFPAWEHGRANVIGAVVEADDTPGYAAKLGYPLALAEMLPMLVNGFRPLTEAARFAEAWLERTPVGADLTRIVSHLVLDLLADPGLADMTQGSPDLEQSRQSIMALHKSVIEGAEPDRKVWKAARMAAVVATDGVGQGTLERQAGSVIEAAAWPGTMRTVLRDTMNSFGSLGTNRSMAEIGWGADKESRVFQIREQAEKDGYKAEFSGVERVLAILDADHPELASGFRQRIERMNKSSATYVSHGWKAIELMEQAPIAAAVSPS